jgi:hypothetical protein
MINNNEVIDSNDGIIKQIKMVPTNKIDLLIKLAIINKIVTDLEPNIYPSDNNDNNISILLPRYITIKQERNKPHLIFDKNNSTNEEKILNLRDVLPDNYILEEQLNVFKDRIKQKYELEL